MQIGMKEKKKEKRKKKIYFLSNSENCHYVSIYRGKKKSLLNLIPIAVANWLLLLKQP